MRAGDLDEFHDRLRKPIKDLKDKAPVKNFFEQYKECIQNRRKDVLTELIVAKIRDLLNNFEPLKSICDEKKLHCIHAGVHYISYALGEWCRAFDDDGYRKRWREGFSRAPFQEAYEQVPIELDLLPTLLRDVALFVFGDYAPSDKVIKGEYKGTPYEKDLRFLRFSSSQWKKLQQLACRSDFFDWMRGIQNENDQRDLKGFIGKNDVKPEFLKVTRNLKNKFSPLSGYYKKYEDLLKILSFSVYSTLHLDFDKLNTECLYLLIFPIRNRIGRYENIATFAGSFLKKPGPEDIEMLRFYFELFIRSLAAEESAISGSTLRATLVMAEDSIRRCTTIDKNVVNDLNEYAKELVKCLNKIKIKTGINEPKNGVDIDKVEDEGARGFLDSFVGRSQQVLDIIDQLYHQLVEKSGDKNEPISLFFFSEAGTGKENLVKLTHLLSPRSRIWLADNNKFIEQVKRDWPLTLNKYKKAFKEIHQFKYNGKKFEKFKYDEKKPVFENRLGNYTTVNMGALRENNFEEFLFGSSGTADRPAILGEVVKVALAQGTVFFDEFNALNPPSLAGAFLRFLEKPYHISVAKEPPEIPVNLMTVFASNKNRDELIELKFNSAVVFRVTRNPFCVPPLRERKEDIALFICNSLVKYNKKQEGNKKVKYFDPNGMRVLVELDWPDNYRGLQGFMDDLLLDRDRRKISDPVIGFRDVVDCLRRRELLGRRL